MLAYINGIAKLIELFKINQRMLSEYKESLIKLTCIQYGQSGQSSINYRWVKIFMNSVCVKVLY